MEDVCASVDEELTCRGGSGPHICTFEWATNPEIV